jgi:hypothetical protein
MDDEHANRADARLLAAAAGDPAAFARFYGRHAHAVPRRPPPALKRGKTGREPPAHNRSPVSAEVSSGTIAPQLFDRTRGSVPRWKPSHHHPPERTSG